MVAWEMRKQTLGKGVLMMQFDVLWCFEVGME